MDRKVFLQLGYCRAAIRAFSASYQFLFSRPKKHAAFVIMTAGPTFLRLNFSPQMCFRWNICQPHLWHVSHFWWMSKWPSSTSVWQTRHIITSSSFSISLSEVAVKVLCFVWCFVYKNKCFLKNNWNVVSDSVDRRMTSLWRQIWQKIGVAQWFGSKGAVFL